MSRCLKRIKGSSQNFLHLLIKVSKADVSNTTADVKTHNTGSHYKSKIFVNVGADSTLTELNIKGHV